MQKHFISTLHLWQWHARRTLPPRPVVQRCITPRHGTRSKTISVSLRAAAIFKPPITNTMNPYGFGQSIHSTAPSPTLREPPLAHTPYLWSEPTTPHPRDNHNLWSFSQENTFNKHSRLSHRVRSSTSRHRNLELANPFHWSWWFKSAWGSTTVSRCHKTSLTNQLSKTYGFYYSSSDLKMRDLQYRCSAIPLFGFDMFDHFGMFPQYIICCKHSTQHTDKGEM